MDQYAEPSSTVSEALTTAAHSHRAGDLRRAEEINIDVLRDDPGNVQALYQLGAAYQAQGKLGEAEAAFQEALTFKPDFPEALNNLAVALACQRRLDEAMACLRRALRYRPEWTELHINLANMLRDQSRLDEASASYQQVLNLSPGHAEAHNLLGSTLAIQGRLAGTKQHFQEALRLQPRYAVAHSNLLLALNYDAGIDPASLFAEHCFWERLHGQGLALMPVHHNDRSLERRLRIGYVSPDFRSHAAARFIEPVLANHDPGQLETFAYAEVAAGDAVTARFQSVVKDWRPTYGRTDAQVAEQVRADGIDILVDLAGHSANNRLGVFTHKPAPVQVTYLGYPNTTGLTTIDYRLTDAVADPPGEPGRHTEELVCLPGCFCCYSPPEDAPEVTPLPARQRGHITFGSLHHLAKLNAEVLDLWCAVLRAVPAAHLLVFRNTLAGKPREALQRQFMERGIDANRIELRNETEAGARYLGVYGSVDILLDAFPWSGHATTCEALWMGVPVVTLRGTRHAGRMSASVLTQLGLAEWLAATPEEYLAAAAGLAGDWDRLADVRSRMRDLMRSSPLCDGKMFARNLERTYREMWGRWCARVRAEPAVSRPRTPGAE